MIYEQHAWFLESPKALDTVSLKKFNETSVNN